MRKKIEIILAVTILTIFSSNLISGINNISLNGFETEDLLHSADPPTSYTNDNSDGSPRRVGPWGITMADLDAAYEWTVYMTSGDWSQYYDYNDYLYAKYGGNVFSSWNTMYFSMYWDTLEDQYEGSYSLDSIEIAFKHWVIFYGQSASFYLKIYNCHSEQYESLFSDVYNPVFWDMGEFHYVTFDETDLSDSNLEHYVSDYGKVKIRAIYYVESKWTWIFFPFWGQWNSIIKTEVDLATVKTTWIL